jgi:hypothetical protein
VENYIYNQSRKGGQRPPLFVWATWGSEGRRFKSARPDHRFPYASPPAPEAVQVMTTSKKVVPLLGQVNVGASEAMYSQTVSPFLPR